MNGCGGALRVSVIDCGNRVYRIDSVQDATKVDDGVIVDGAQDFVVDVLSCALAREGRTLRSQKVEARIDLRDKRIWLTAWYG